MLEKIAIFYLSLKMRKRGLYNGILIIKPFKVQLFRRSMKSKEVAIDKDNITKLTDFLIE